MRRTLDIADATKVGRPEQRVPDGLFPVHTRRDLRGAIESIGRARDKAEARRWIKKRARDLNGQKLVPEGW
jgi:hypothetical protein